MLYRANVIEPIILKSQRQASGRLLVAIAISFTIRNLFAIKKKSSNEDANKYFVRCAGL